ncbi:DUF308 domain-containing protein [Saccharopolyspora sp. HNM0983]|uniref:DUF308 domain-containing protein n=1 Tax=Saccharopolyspora montiporae TaxID=2781240 RepID=A0A929B4Q3_9PSEU|nr:DUF308 domain-containing protein [Saccharopolyspora sp. HNM0983]MBE9373139.1 DUF308 domain-containing protein [Saccharopolyspora sp. HNM0983]
MSTRRDSADGPEDIDAAFAEIVADLEKDATFSQWPQETGSPGADGTADDPGPDPVGATGAAATAPAPEPEAESGPRDWTPSEVPDDEHYVPPEPPPLPTPKPVTLAGVAVIAVGLLVLLVPGLAGLASTVTLPLGLVLISAGIGWLLLRLRQGPSDPEDDAGDDGARL